MISQIISIDSWSRPITTIPNEETTVEHFLSRTPETDKMNKYNYNNKWIVHNAYREQLAAEELLRCKLIRQKVRKICKHVEKLPDNFPAILFEDYRKPKHTLVIDKKNTMIKILNRNPEKDKIEKYVYNKWIIYNTYREKELAVNMQKCKMFRKRAHVICQKIEKLPKELVDFTSSNQCMSQTDSDQLCHKNQ